MVQHRSSRGSNFCGGYGLSGVVVVVDRFLPGGDVPALRPDDEAQVFVRGFNVEVFPAWCNFGDVLAYLCLQPRGELLSEGDEHTFLYF